MGAEAKRERKYYPKLKLNSFEILNYYDFYNYNDDGRKQNYVDCGVLRDNIKELIILINYDYDDRLDNRTHLHKLSGKINHPKNIYSEDGIIVYFVETENYIFYTKKNRLYFQDKFIEDRIIEDKIQKNKHDWERLLDEMSREEFLEHISKYVFPSKLVE